MTLERRDLVGLNVILSIVSVATFCILANVITKQNAELEQTRAPAAKLEIHCGFIRLQLAEELDWLTADSKQKQVMAQIQFDHFAADGWRGVALCTPDGVQIPRSLCLDGDVACMSTATATAMLMVGAR